MNELYLLGDLARILNTRPSRIVYLLTSGQVPEPAKRMGSRRVFTFEDMANIADKLGIHDAIEVQAKDARRAN